MSPDGMRRMVKSAVGTDPDDFDGATLQWIADGPLCDPVRHYCPAGRLTWAKVRAREAEALR